MFLPGDPRAAELRTLAAQAMTDGLRDQDRPRWRELTGQLLGSINEAEGHENRRHLRAAAELEVDLIAPDEIASLVTTTVGAGGVSLLIQEPIEPGTLLEFSIKLAQRPVPLFCRAKVVWRRGSLLGAAFIDLFQNDRELLEGIVVQQLLA
jgi:hypothetical protein